LKIILSPNTEQILVEESNKAEQTLIQNIIHKNDNTLVATIVNQKVFCHACSPATEMTNPVPFTMGSGKTIHFCNEAELNGWKSQYNIQ